MLNHGSSMIMMDATHNSVSNHFLLGGAKVSLWTFMIWDPVVGKGLPVAWAFTGSAAERVCFTFETLYLELKDMDTDQGFG